MNGYIMKKHDNVKVFVCLFVFVKVFGWFWLFSWREKIWLNYIKFYNLFLLKTPKHG